MNRRQTIPKHLRYTINDFNAQFPDNDACLEHLKEQRWPNGITHCEKCGVERKHHRVTGRPAYACDYCGSMISPMAGTIFEKSTTSLRLWYYAMYLMASTRCGISAKQIQRETGVTYKTAWRMFKQIRSLLSEPEMKLEGLSVEMDESYFGAKRKRGTKKGRPSPTNSHKTAVVGVVERTGKGRVFATVADNTTKNTLHGIAKERIMPESTIFTDEYYSYNGLDQQGYTHRRINHSAGVYVMGDVHTNTIEGFWGLVKRGIGGVYHQVSRKYLQSYLDEFSFRYNRRDQGNLIFTSFLKRVCERAV
jgi:transposase-like protein